METCSKLRAVFSSIHLPSDHMSSSDTHVHTPSTSSSLSLQASSATSSEGSRTRPSRADIKSRLRPEIPERRSMRLMANDEKALDLYFSAFFDDEEGDEEYLPVEDWKQVPKCCMLRSRWGWTFARAH